MDGASLSSYKQTTVDPERYASRLKEKGYTVRIFYRQKRQATSSLPSLTAIHSDRVQVHLDHSSSKTKNQMKRTLLLDVIIRQGPSILQLLSGENQSLLVRRNTLLVLDLGLDVVDSVGRLDFESDSLSGQGLDKDLHTSTKTEDEMQGRFLLDV
jgi:hypothetical protein